MSGAEIARESLYELVWRKPMTALAGQLGVSDVAVIKACKKLDVPRPPRGYWARRQHGYPVPDAPALQPRRHGEPLSHTFMPHERAVVPNFVTEPPPLVVVNPRSQTHEALREIRVALAEARPDNYGRVGPTDRGINVSPQLVPRATRVLGALFTALEGRGHPVKSAEGNLSVVVSGEEIRIAAYEGANRVQVALRGGYQSWNYKPSGLLMIKVSVPFMYGMRRQWSDTKNSQIDAKLGEIVVVLESMVPAIRAQRESDELRERRWQRERLEEQRAEDRLRFIRQRAARIDALVENFEKATKIRELVSAIELSATAPADSRRLARWARRYADHLDPLVDFTLADLGDDQRAGLDD